MVTLAALNTQSHMEVDISCMDSKRHLSAARKAVPLRVIMSIIICIMLNIMHIMLHIIAAIPV